MSSKRNPKTLTPLPEPVRLYEIRGGGGGDHQCEVRITARSHTYGYHLEVTTHPGTQHTAKLWAKALRQAAADLERLP